VAYVFKFGQGKNVEGVRVRATNWLCLAAMLGLTGLAAAQAFPAGYNNVESAVKPYTALDPLLFADGKPVTARTWPKRRAEILALFEENVFGRTPASALGLPVRAHVDEQDDHALGGKAIRKQIHAVFLREGRGRAEGASAALSSRGASGQDSGAAWHELCG